MELTSKEWQNATKRWVSKSKNQTRELQAFSSAPSRVLLVSYLELDSHYWLVKYRIRAKQTPSNSQAKLRLVELQNASSQLKP